MKYLLVLILLMPLSLLAQTMIPISGLGEIRFDKKLKDVIPFLEVEHKLDTACESINKTSYASGLDFNPSLRVFSIKKHLENIDWKTATAYYDNSKLIYIVIENSNKELYDAIKDKYGSPQKQETQSEITRSEWKDQKHKIIFISTIKDGVYYNKIDIEIKEGVYAYVKKGRDYFDALKKRCHRVNPKNKI